MSPGHVVSLSRCNDFHSEGFSFIRGQKFSLMMNVFWFQNDSYMICQRLFLVDIYLLVMKFSKNNEEEQ